MSLVKPPLAARVPAVRPPQTARVSLVKDPAAELLTARDRKAYDEFCAQTVPRAAPPESARPRRRRLVAVAAVAALWLVAGATSVAVITRSGPDDSEVLGQRFEDPAGAPAAAAPSDPQEVSETATVDVAGVVSLTQTLVWQDAVPAVLDVRQPDLVNVPGLPDDVRAALGQPVATAEGRPLPVLAQAGGTWRVTTGAGETPGAVVLTYQVADAVHRDQASPPDRALVVIPLPPLGAGTDGPRQLSLPSDRVLNVSCPLPAQEAVVLCGTREDGRWLVTVPPDGDVVLAQLDLPAL